MTAWQQKTELKPESYGFGLLANKWRRRADRLDAPSCAVTTLKSISCPCHLGAGRGPLKCALQLQDLPAEEKVHASRLWAPSFSRGFWSASGSWPYHSSLYLSQTRVSGGASTCKSCLKGAAARAKMENVCKKSSGKMGAQRKTWVTDKVIRRCSAQRSSLIALCCWNNCWLSVEHWDYSVNCSCIRGV